MILTLIINTYCLTLCLPLFALRTGNCCRSRYCSTASRKIADRETLRQPRSLFSRLIASSDKWRKTVFIAITTTLHILLINVCAKITPENHLKKRIFACCFVFARCFPEIIRVLQLFHLLLKNGLVIAQDELWMLWIYYIQGCLFLIGSLFA